VAGQQDGCRETPLLQVSGVVDVLNHSPERTVALEGLRLRSLCFEQLLWWFTASNFSSFLVILAHSRIGMVF
jgi:hypothetical protein